MFRSANRIGVLSALSFMMFACVTLAQERLHNTAKWIL